MMSFIIRIVLNLVALSPIAKLNVTISYVYNTNNSFVKRLFSIIHHSRYFMFLMVAASSSPSMTLFVGVPSHLLMNSTLTSYYSLT